jgi:phosphatidate cytidylyltransferase
MVNRNLANRLKVAGVGIPLCALVTYMGGYVFAAGLGAIAAIGYWEFARMVRSSGLPVLKVPGVLAAFLYPFVLLTGQLRGAVFYSVGLVMAFTAFAMATIPIERKPIQSAAVTVFGVIYVGGLLAFGILLREGLFVYDNQIDSTADRTTWSMFFLFPVVITWVADTAAYFGGRRYGKRKMAPKVSPNKTLAGAIFGVIAAIAIAPVYSHILLPDLWVFGWSTTIAFGLVVGGVAIVGDLAESALKRECDVKDSSNLLPGHGGMLDRLDSALWALPATFFFMLLVN